MNLNESDTFSCCIDLVMVRLFHVHPFRMMQVFAHSVISTIYVIISNLNMSCWEQLRK